MKKGEEEDRSKRKQHDPIHYLRAARGSGTGDPSLDDLRRTDSDDDLFAFTIDGHLLHPTVSTVSVAPTLREETAITTTTVTPAADANDQKRNDCPDESFPSNNNVTGTNSVASEPRNDQSHRPDDSQSPSSSGLSASTNRSNSESDSNIGRLNNRDEHSSNKVTIGTTGTGASNTNGTLPPKPEPRKAYRPQSMGPCSSSEQQPMEEPPARERPDASQAWPYRETLSFTRSLVFYGAGSITTEHEQACASIQTARTLRQAYFGGKGVVMADNHETLLLDTANLSFAIGAEGVAEIYHSSDPTTNLIQVPTVEQFQADYHRLVELTSEGTMRSFCFQRLQILSTSFKMHTTLNSTVEMEEQSNLLGNDFYRTMKVDNHIHAAAAPSAKQFVQFVRRKLETEAETVVSKETLTITDPVTGEPQVVTKEKTLAQVYEEAGLDMDHLTIDAFNVLADYSVYQRFDNFNNKYSPFRMADMRRIFLKTTNNNDGRYFAELLKMVLNRHETSMGHNSACEMRLSIYGMERHEWYDLSKWLLTDWKHPDSAGNLISSHNRWLIQVPRLWRIYSQKPVVNGQPQRSFLEMIENIFSPLFQATLDPASHPEIAEAARHIVGFDSVDDEGALEEPCSCQRPHQWTSKRNPSYWWQLYFLWANLQVLNRLRKALGLNTFSFRPHAGETGDPMHLAATYILCDSINHGILLDAQVSLQYLYYLDQVGLSVSPLSNNFLFARISSNPFPKFFRRGLNCCISTDDPLLFHLSDDALLEEYSVARATFDLSMTDLMEIARNSVMQSGFEEEFKEKWLGRNYKNGLTFCDENITHVPLIRAKFRAEHLAIEHMLVHLIAAGKGDVVLKEMKQQFGLARDAHRDVLFDNFEEVPSFPERGQL